jgi:glycosyltransferase involved in cell wall biosynthesis
MEVSVILPCQNEQDALEDCILSIRKVMDSSDIHGYEIIVSDSSVDKSPEIALRMGVRLVQHGLDGYGIACMEGLNVASGRYLVLADADGTYDFCEIPQFIANLRSGADFVIGNRFDGGMDPGAMPLLHRYIGNPALSLLFRAFFGSDIADVHCGMRAITKEAYQRLNLMTTGMEFATEMLIKAQKKGLNVKQIPIGYHTRKGDSKLTSFADGWRHLRFMLLYCPLFLFLIPGTMLFVLGVSTMAVLYFGSPSIWGLRFFYHPMFLSSSSIVIGYQLIIFSLFAKTYAIAHLGEDSSSLRLLYQHLTLERALVAGFAIALTGTIAFGLILLKWLTTSFGAMQEVKNSILGLTLLAIGMQTIFSSFMLSMLSIKEK